MPPAASGRPLCSAWSSQAFYGPGTPEPTYGLFVSRRSLRRSRSSSRSIVCVLSLPILRRWTVIPRRLADRGASNRNSWTCRSSVGGDTSSNTMRGCSPQRIVTSGILGVLRCCRRHRLTADLDTTATAAYAPAQSDGQLGRNGTVRAMRAQTRCRKLQHRGGQLPSTLSHKNAEARTKRRHEVRQLLC